MTPSATASAALLALLGVACAPGSGNGADASTDACNAPAGNVGMNCTSSTQCGCGEFCDFGNACGTEGACRLLPNACGGGNCPVCGCDGKTYESVCETHLAGLSVSYAAPCRTASVVSCDDTHTCPEAGICVLDPRAACDGSPTCPGVCLHPAFCAAECVIARGASCSGDAGGLLEAGGCIASVDGTSVACDGGGDCPSGQLCVLAANCDDGGPTAQSFCVVP